MQRGLPMVRRVATLGAMPNESTDDPIPVIAAVIERGGRYLMGLRPDHKRHGGLWEFPGGKLIAGESWEAAAARELLEELGLTLERLGATLFEMRDPGSRFLIRFAEARVSGTVVLEEHTAVGWFDIDELRAMPLAPSDAAFVAWRSEVIGA